jgi:hypothetical protein
MQILFTNRHIAFAVESIWENLNYKFKYQLNQLMTANSADDYVQTVEVPEEIMIQIYKSVTNKPEGISSGINHQMNLALFEQIQPLANLEQVQQGAEPNEAARILIAINAINDSNVEVLNAKILNGKTQILE